MTISLCLNQAPANGASHIKEDSLSNRTSVEDLNEAKRIDMEWKRPKHEQILDEASAIPQQPFEGCQFIAHLKGRDVKFNQFGGLDITLSIPVEMVDYALPLRHAFRRGVVLSIDAQPWRPYTDAMTEFEDE
jgi:hypothetical protein